MNKQLLAMSVCLCLSSAAAAVAGGPVHDGVDFDRGVDIPAFLAAAPLGPEAAPRPAAADLLVPEFRTMGRYEGGRVDALPLVVSIEAQISAGDSPGFVRLVMKFPEIPKDNAALALDPGVLETSIGIPLKYYSEIFESPRFFLDSWEAGGKGVRVYSSYNDRSRYLEITQTVPAVSGGFRTEVLKLTVVGEEIVMGKVEKYRPGFLDEPYFDEYIVRAEKTAQGLALKAPGLLGRIQDPALVKYVAESPTPERIREALGVVLP